MKTYSVCLLLGLCYLQTRADTVASNASVNHSTASGADFLRDKSRSVGASLRLTAYDLPKSVLYYLPSLPGRRAINQTRPQRNKYVCQQQFHQGRVTSCITFDTFLLTCRYPQGWRLLFCPAVVSLSPHRWCVPSYIVYRYHQYTVLAHACLRKSGACRLVYDGHGHFQAYDDTGPEEYDFYDYDEAHPPPGCTLGAGSGFLENNVPSGVAWEDVPKAKAAFGINEQALQYCNASASNGCTSLAVLPYICAAVPATFATSSGKLLALFPMAALLLGIALLVAAAVVLLIVLASGLLRSLRRQ